MSQFIQKGSYTFHRLRHLNPEKIYAADKFQNLEWNRTYIYPLSPLNQGFKWSLTNMSVAILAKLGGIPWMLSTLPKEELVVGVGAFRHPDGVQFLSSAFCFNNTGHFNEFDYFMKHETDVMAGKIAAKVKDFATTYGNPSRLIIHFYKERMSQEEIAPIEAALQDLQLPNPIPIFIIHVNKTEAKDLIAYDIDWINNWMPYSGTYIGNRQQEILIVQQ